MKQQNDFLSRSVRAGLLLPLLLAGCSDEMHVFRPDDGASGLRIELQATIDQTADTRADESGFADGDRFGLFVVNYSDGQPSPLTLSANQVNNVAMTYSAGANRWKSATDIYWRDPITPTDVYGYYPFNNGLSSTDAYSFEVRADQSVKAEGEMSAYEASDFLWAKTSKATPGKKVELTFSHAMAGVKVMLQQGDGFDGDSWTKLDKTVTVDNTIRTSEIDLSTGVVTPVGSYDRNVVMNPESDGWRAVVIPQTVATGKSNIGITIDGKSYAYTRTEGMKYNPGKLHAFTIKIDRKADTGEYALTLVDEAITPWEADKSSHDFESNSYIVVHVAEAGTLHACLQETVNKPSSIKNLKISGELTESDFEYIKTEIPLLEAINLKNAHMAEITKKIWDYNPTLGHDGWMTVTLKDELPEEAFLGMARLKRIILPEDLKSIGKYALCELTLQSDLNIPDGVTIIKKNALSGLRGDVTVNIPKSLEIAKEGAYGGCSVNVLLELPKSLKTIESGAFTCANASGVFSLPPQLEFMDEGAFSGCGSKSNALSGDIEIPLGISKIPADAFSSMGFRSGCKVKFHDGVTEIGRGAFWGIGFSSPVVFPKNLQVIAEAAFAYAEFVGDVIFPTGLTKLDSRAFSYSNLKNEVILPSGIEELSGGYDKGHGGPFSNTNIEKLIIGDNIEQINAYACQGCPQLQYVEIGKNVNLIDNCAFSDCEVLTTIVCYSLQPPALGDNVFSGVDLSHCILEVPENSVETYRHDDAWKVFANITPHHELGLSISEIKALNKGLERSVMVRAEGAWEITECPSWIQVDRKAGDYKQDITVKIAPMAVGDGHRVGKVFFKLKDSDYTNYLTVSQFDYMYDEDKEIIIQSASEKGKAIPLFIVGEGYGAESIVNGDYLKRVNETVEQLFSIEPYKTYRDMFSVSASVAFSPDDGAQDLVSAKMTKFDLIYPEITESMDFRDRIADIKNYVCEVSADIDRSNINNALIIVLANYDAFGGSAYIDNAGCAIAMIGNSQDAYPYDNRGLVQFYAGGVAFGGLADESISHMDNIKGCTCPYCNALGEYHLMKSKGFFENVTISGNMSDSPWHDFIFHPSYSGIVDMWEGGYNHLRGVWRSEAASVMSNFIAYYNTVSRFAIYKRIMMKAGLPYSLEEFIANDKIEIPD